MGTFGAWFDELAAIGRDPATGGYRRLAFTPAERQAREWFGAAAAGLGLDVETDRNGNVWAYWGGRADVVATGSHLDTVVDGGAFDGALGVVGGLAAIEALRARGHRPRRSLAVVAWLEEEGARFGVPTLGSRLATGTLAADRARGLRDAAGVALAEASDVDPAGFGPDPDRIGALTAFVELHIEQGRGLADLGQPVGRIDRVWPHGRWRLDLTGAADHAGAARLEDRRDPVLVAAAAAMAARAMAERLEGRATVGRLEVSPNTTNTVAASATAWLDARAPAEEALRELVADWTTVVTATGGHHGVEVAVREESFSPGVEFDRELRNALTAAGLATPGLPTAAGHDAAILAAHVPAAMLHVRNPTGVSHSPAEHASRADCEAGVAALTDVLARLTS